MHYYRPQPSCDLQAAESLLKQILEAEQAIEQEQARERIKNWNAKMMKSLQGSGKEASRWAAVGRTGQRPTSRLKGCPLDPPAPQIRPSNPPHQARPSRVQAPRRQPGSRKTAVASHSQTYEVMSRSKLHALASFLGLSSPTLRGGRAGARPASALRFRGRGRGCEYLLKRWTRAGGG